ncbi:MAG TPA: Asp-tRNA(Asn)/Glu-tRNA(Gln) amidotransferase subunit GatA [Bdellovibrionota bacterium]|jgi:aspartyl-tRNA(Asn)/glutamyl-tRNA(Gln) amidotransferase subunit A
MMQYPRHLYKKAWEWRAQLGTGKTTPAKVAEEYLARIKADKTNSFLTLMEAETKAAATKVNAAKGPLAGIPLAIKDNLVTLGVKTTCASKILENYVPPYTATVVKKLYEAGAVPMGKCNLDEFAMGSSNENSAFGPVLLPQDHARVPGGSSGGSAAAVAGNLAVVALGSDTGGSVRQPASFCGVVGLKPTYGRVSRYGLVAFASSLDQVGPLALDAQDCADLLETISGFDPNDSTSLERKVPEFGKAVEAIRTNSGKRNEFLKSLKVGVPAEFFADGLDPTVKKAVEGAIEALKKSGTKVVPVSLPHSKYALAVYYVVAVSEASANLARFDGVRFGTRVLPNGAQTSLEEMYEATRGTLFGNEVKRRILLGTFALSSGYYDAYYKRACQVRALVAKDFSQCFEKVDVIIGPTTPTVSFERGSKTNDPLAMYLSDIYTVPINLAGIPAVSMPYGTGEKGLPVGLQLIGAPFAEQKLLETVAALEVLHDEGKGA